ncbi:MAG: hypothetical protein KBT11_06065 [Treponema sp.]|nr:hypothetical protein [Candidatus Treponema equifaecale]
MRKAVVNNDDYDFYSIKLPLRMAFNRRLKKVVLKEVEKRHPKLSLSTKLDSHFSVSGGMLKADVAVMENAKLAGYKRLFPKHKLYLENTGSQDKRAFFSEKNWKSLVLYSILISVFLFFSFKLVQEVILQQKKIEMKESMYLGKVDSEEKTENLLSPDEVVSSVYSSVSKNGGRISAFSWKNGFCNFSINGCGTDNILQAQYCVVSYKNNRPFFSLSIPVKAEEYVSEKKSQKTGTATALSHMRGMLFELGADIHSEKTSDDAVELCFSISQELFYTALKCIGTEADQADWVETVFTVEKNGGKNKVEIVFSREYENSENEMSSNCFRPALLTASYAWLFKDEELKLVPAAKKASTKGFILPRKENNRGQKLGEIRKADGSLIIYYRNEGGKLAYEEIGNAM